MAEDGDRIELLVELLKRVHTRLDKLDGDLSDLKVRISSIEQGQAIMRQELAHQSAQIAGLNARMDRFDERLMRIEKRLDLIEA
jgi:chromosome segregation ATPase